MRLCRRSFSRFRRKSLARRYRFMFNFFRFRLIGFYSFTVFFMLTLNMNFAFQLYFFALALFNFTLFGFSCMTGYFFIFRLDAFLYEKYVIPRDFSIFSVTGNTEIPAYARELFHRNLFFLCYINRFHEYRCRLLITLVVLR
jgi:hypothetical protein